MRLSRCGAFKRERTLRAAVLDGVMVTVELIYPKQGICLEHHPRSSLIPMDPDMYPIRASTPIKAIFYEDFSVSGAQNELGCMASIDANPQHPYAQTWTGYGEYAVYQEGIAP